MVRESKSNAAGEERPMGGVLGNEVDGALGHIVQGFIGHGKDCCEDYLD